MRRLPIFLVLDISESMLGEPIECLEKGMYELLQNLRSDPYALETAFLSVIAFAGRVETLVELTEIYQFQIPQLSLGAGTNIGAAMEHLINEIKTKVKKSTTKEKGDFKPIIYFLSDGTATDNPQPAIARFQKEIGTQAKFIAVGIGKNADLSIFRPISEEILRLTNTSAVDFKKFIDWVSQSITAQSKSVGAYESIDKISLEKAEHNEAMEIMVNETDFLAKEESFIIFQGKCSQTGKIYLLKFERENSKDNPDDYRFHSDDFAGYRDDNYQTAAYIFSVAVKAPENYEYWSGQAGLGREINTNSILIPMEKVKEASCPHCGNPYTIALCGCGALICTAGEGHKTQCPNCNREIVFEGGGGDFEINKSRG